MYKQLLNSQNRGYRISILFCSFLMLDVNLELVQAISQIYICHTNRPIGNQESIKNDIEYLGGESMTKAKLLLSTSFLHFITFYYILLHFITF
jgi:hypothetical protein